jgi:undecaprenyl-diphosphatase
LDSKLDNHGSSQKPWPIATLTWLGGHELAVMVGVTLVIAGVWLVIVLAGGVVDGRTSEIDMAILMALREGGDPNNPLGPPWVEEMMRDFTALGGTGLLTLIVGAIALYYVIQGRNREMLVLITAVAGAYLLSYVLKGLFDRPRPEFIPPSEYLYTASFPSGHALLAASTYLTLAGILAQLLPRRRLKAYVLILALFVVLLVGFSRLYLGVHWPSDVLAGWLIGSVWAIAWWLAVRWLRRRGRLSTLSVKDVAS